MSAWLKERRERIWFAAVVNLIILCALLLIFRPAFETNDDMAIALFINGAKGSYDAHLVYSNYLLGLVLSALYRITGRLPWYSLLQYAVLFLSFTAIFHVLARKLKSTSAVCVSAIVIWIFAYDGYIRIQYTKTAGIAAVAGLLLLLYAAGQEKAGWKLPGCGYLLACLGFMYREQQFLAELALMSGIGLFLLLEGAEERAGEAGRRLRRCVLFFGALALSVCCLHLADRHAYSSPEWQEYLEYNELRTELLDFGFPAYKENKKEYQSLGINRTALQLYRGWNHADTEKFTPEVMRSLIALKKKRAISPQLLIDFLKEVPGRLLHRLSFWCLIMVLLYRLCCRGYRKSAVIAIVYEILLAGGLYLLLYYSGRYLYNRVDVGLFLAILLTFLWTSPSGKEVFPFRAGVALLLAAALIPQIAWKDTWRLNSAAKLERMQRERNVLESIASDKEHLYIVKSGAISYARGYGVFDPLPYGVSENILLLGGWPALTPAYRELMGEFGVTNPYRDLLGNDRLLLIDNDIDSTLEYIRKYYDKSAQAVLVTEYPGCNVYRLSV